MRKFWILMMILLLAVLPTAAQDEPVSSGSMQTDFPPDALHVLDVTLSADGILDVEAEHTDGCEYPVEIEQRFENGILWIDLIRLDEMTDNTCTSEPVPVTFSISLDEPIEDSETLLVVNDFAARVDLSDPAAPQIVPQVRLPMQIDSIELRYDEGADNPYTLYLAGQHPTGCEAPVIEDVEIADSTINVQVYKVQSPEAKVCPMILLMYENAIPLEGEFFGLVGINVNGESILYDVDRNTAVADDDPYYMKVEHVIETVDAMILESFPPQISIHVVGYQSDGCEFPVQVDQRREGNEVFVQIYRRLSIATTCLAVIVPYEANINLGSFEMGETYTIHVNGVTVEVEL